MSIETALERMSKAAEALAKGEKAEDGPVEMSPEDFMTYAADQMEKAQADAPEIREARLAALAENVADVQKNFEGSIKTPGGLLAVKQFRDPAQVQTTMKTVNPTTPPAGAANFASNGEPPAVNGAGAAPTGKLVPPTMASGSGFESPAAATFAKAMGDLMAVLKGEAPAPAENAPSGDEKGSQTAEGGETDPKPVEKKEGSEGEGDGKAAGSDDPPASEPVAKSTGVVWPHDMNTPFGRGETNDDEVPEWGRDGGAIPEDKPAE